MHQNLKSSLYNGTLYTYSNQMHMHIHFYIFVRNFLILFQLTVYLEQPMLAKIPVFHIVLQHSGRKEFLGYI